MRRKGKKYINVSTNKKDLTYKGFVYKSRLEAQMAKMLDEAGLPINYEGYKFTIIKEEPNGMGCYRKTVDNKGEYKVRDKNINAVRYTPDFIDDDIKNKENAFIIECKGRPTPVFMLRFKLFQRYCKKYYPNVKLYMPRNISQCRETINLILKHRK